MPHCSEESQNRIVNYLQIIIPEFFGTTILLFIACLGSTTGDLLQQCLTQGLAVLTAMQIFGHMSGAHINPAISVAALICGQIGFSAIPLYVIPQLCGSLAGFALFRIVLPAELYSENIGMTLSQNRHLEAKHIFAIEFFVSIILVFANCATWDFRTRRMYDSVALRIGLIVAVLNCIAAPYTGCSMNPARSFGPAVWYCNWKQHWIYWVAPLTAAVVGALFYKCLVPAVINVDRRRMGIIKESS